MQPVDQSAVLHHPADCQCQGNSHRGRESLRNCRNGNGDSGHEHFKHRLTPEHTGQEYRAADQQADHRHHLSQAGQTLLQWCHVLLHALKHGGNLSHLRLNACGNDNGIAAAPKHRCSGIDQVFLVEHVLSVFWIAGLFGHGL